MLLYDFPESGNCFKVRLLFAHLGIEYDKQFVDPFDFGAKKELLGDLNPVRRVPTLVLDDGRPLAESNAILTSFAEGTAYLPEDRYARAQVFQWLFFEQFSHQPPMAITRVWGRAQLDIPAEQRAEQLKLGNNALRALDRHLDGREFIVDDTYSIADIALYAYTHVAHEGGHDLAPYANVRSWLARVAAQARHVAIDARPSA
jgi:glutathione S-transferase